MVFKNPVFFILLPLAVAALLFARRSGRQAAFRFSSARLIPAAGGSWKLFVSRRMVYARAACVALALAALARPQ